MSKVRSLLRVGGPQSDKELLLTTGFIPMGLWRETFRAMVRLTTASSWIVTERFSVRCSDLMGSTPANKVQISTGFGLLATYQMSGLYTTLEISSIIACYLILNGLQQLHKQWLLMNTWYLELYHFNPFHATLWLQRHGKVNTESLLARAGARFRQSSCRGFWSEQNSNASGLLGFV